MFPLVSVRLNAKFADCAQLVLSADRVQRALAQVESIDTLKDVRELVRTLSPDNGTKRG